MKTRSTESTVRQEAQRLARATVQTAILAGAERLLARGGLRHFKMSDLAAEAGVAVGTIYNYYPSREDLLSGLVADGQARFYGYLAEAYELDGPLARLEAILRRTADFIETHGALFTELLAAVGTPDGDLRCLGGVDPDSGHRRYRAVLEAELSAAAAAHLIRAEPPPAELAVCLGGLLSATILHWVETDRSYLLAERIATAYGLFLHGVTPR